MSNLTSQDREAPSTAGPGPSHFGGVMGKLVWEKDWSQTPLGPIESWPQSLRTTVNLCLASNFPISLAWGPNHVQIYNDGYWPICGDKHPGAMGQDFSECWASAFPVIGDAFRSALAGTTAFLEDQRMFLDRLGYLEETFFTFSFSPIRDETGQVVGLFHPVTETTSKMLGQRRTRTLRDLATQGLKAQSLEDALLLAAQALVEADLDVPFVLFYRIDEGGRRAHLASQSGLPLGGPASPTFVDLTQESAIWPLARIAGTGKGLQLDDLCERFDGLVGGPYPEPIRSAILQPIIPSGHDRPACIMVAGVSTRLPMNEAYASFFDLLAASVSNVVSNAIASEAERKRAEALAEIDRAKTEFFANVSHEFRTPLTLMLGPLEEELAEQVPASSAIRRERLEIAHRNSLRLLKLVNTLLDFSRIEAGRAKASYQPTDLAACTAELASTFRSAIEKAGLTLTVDCPTLPEPVFVDREMWEKVVLNLLSNAFKHTFAGGIRITLRWCGDHVELAVADSGVGIPAAELPRVFERFHRVKGTRARSHEGTGIGLALVQELIHLHGGTVRVDSQEGQGSTFTATVKTGRAHLPADRIESARLPISIAKGAAAYVEEARLWAGDLPTATAPSLAPAKVSHGNRPHIVWADDNADMREYVRRLLGEHYEVTAVADGAAAVAAAMATNPDLVLTDIMMPVLDGLGVLRQLRADARTRGIPVILLSARAGQEAAISGMDAGADDYLVKPFTTNELLARVRMHLELAKMRRESVLELERRVLERTAELEQSRHALLTILEDQQRAETTLRESEDRYRAVVEHSLIGIYVHEDGIIRFANPAFARMYGYATPKEMIGVDNWSSLVAPEYREKLKARTLGTLQGEAKPNFPGWEGLRKDGTRLWVESNGVRIDWKGRPAVLAFHLDITERKQAEDALRTSEARLTVAQSQAKLGSWEFTFATQTAEWSAQMFRMHGRDLARGAPTLAEVFETVHPDDRQTLETAYARELAEHSGGILDYRVVRPDGRVFWAESRWKTTFDKTGQPVGMSGTLQDITDRNIAKEALRESEERLRLALDAAHMGTFDWDVPHNRITWSRWHEELWGFAPGEFAGTYEAFSERVHPEDLPGVNAEVARCMATRESYAGEFRVVWPDGSVHWIMGQGEFTFGADDKPVHMRGVVMEITERKQAEKAVQASNRRLRELIDGLGPNLFVGLMTSDGMLIEANRPALEAARLKPEDVLGRPFDQAYWWAYSSPVQQQLRAAIARAVAGEPSRYDVQVRVAEGTLIWIDFSIYPLRDQDGRVVYLVPSAAVIDDRKQAEEALHHSHQRLQQLSRRLIEVQETERRHLARELHDEMGQVLTMISVSLKGLKEKLDGTLQARLDESIGYVDRVIQEVRTLSLDLRPAMLDDLGLAAALRWYSERQAERAGFKVELVTESTAGDVPTEVRNACFRVAQESLTNIVRYGKARQVRIELHQREDEVELIVQDDGVGFDVAASRKRAAQGKSVGVLGMQERVELLEGKFEIESAPGHGTTIRARIPLPTDDEETE